MSQKKKDTTNGQKKPAKKDQPQVGQTSLSSWFTQRPASVSTSTTQPSQIVSSTSENSVKVLTRGAKNSPGQSPVISPIGSPKKRSSKTKEEIVLSHTLDKIDAKEKKKDKEKVVKIEEKKPKKVDVKEEKKSKKADAKEEEKGDKEKKSKKLSSSSKKTSPITSPKSTPVTSPEKRKKSKVVISDSDEVDDVMKIEDSVDVEDVVKEVEAMHSLKRHRVDSVISILDAQEEIKNTQRSSATSNKKAKTETGAKKTTPTKVKKESKSMVVEEEVTSSADAIDPRHPNFRPLTNFRIGQSHPPPPNPGSKIIPDGTANCLAGKTFIITGTLDTLERDEAKSLIVKHGGLVNDTLTKKITHVLVGDQFGGAKMLKILKMKLMTYDEDELLDIIRASKPQDPTKTLPIVAEVKHVFVPKEGTSHSLWADKYKPELTTDLVGNSIQINKVKKWLENWQTSVDNETEETKKPFKRAVLITGKPGIGKTTTATILAKELGYEAIVTNASDTRNVSSLQDLLKTNDNKSIAGFMSFAKPTSPQTPKKLIYIMDEIDGMSQGDKGGIGELCRIIPKTKTPIICIANDRFSKKLQALIKYCEDVQFESPPIGQILNRVSVIVKAENYNIPQADLIKVIESTQGDFRQVLNLLQMWSYSEADNSTISKESISLATKDFTLCSDDTIPMFFSRNISLPKKFDAWFVDYTFTPVIIQDRYLHGMPKNNSLEAIARAADSISDGDLIGESIFRKQDFELLPSQGLMSAIIPGHHAHTGGRRQFSPFPIWFAKNKSEQSHREQLFTIQKNTNNHLFSDPEAIGMEYTHLLAHFLTNPMIKDGKEGCQEVLDFMSSYGLSLEDRDSILEYHKAFGKDLTADIPSQTKAAFTRLYNAENWTVKENKGGKKKAEKKGDKVSPKSTTVKKKENVELDMNDMKAKPKKKAAPKKTKNNIDV
jgi:replication factor C subunit 1